MPTPTYDLISTTTVVSTVANVLFSEIPATYRDLILVIDVLGATSGDHNVNLTLNGDTTQGNYSAVMMNGTGSSAVGGTMSQPRDITFWNFLSTGTRMFAICQFLDYRATDKHKTYLTRGNNAATGIAAFAHRWANTAAINSISVASPSNLAATTTVSLYGIAG